MMTRFVRRCVLLFSMSAAVAAMSCSASESSPAAWSTGQQDAGADEGQGGTGGTSPDASPCASNTKMCDGACVGLDDPDYGCGPTGCFPCSIPGAFAMCLQGACALDECLTNRADCNDDESDGCEVDLLTDPTNCKGCGNECPGTTWGAPNCTQGSCSYLCNAGFAPCASGCCPSISSSPGRLVAGRSHSCVVTAAGGVKCWGLAVMNGSSGDSSTAIDVPGLASGVTALASRDSHTCALMQNGGVKCWGDNQYGGLGNGTNGNWTPNPGDVQGLGGPASAVAAGSGFSCAKLTAGGFACWGRNSDGQLGTGNKSDSTVAVPAPKLVALSFVSAGGAHGCGLQNGGIKCWGNNQLGQLGDGTKTAHLAPTDAYNLSAAGAYSIDAVAGHTCAVVGDGSVLCWGDNQYGQLGIGIKTSSEPYPKVPLDVAGEAALVATGYRHTCVLLKTGAVQCWGTGSQGQLGDGDGIDRFTAVNVQGLPSDVVALVSGELHSCALTADEKVYCWGANASGQLGDGSTTNRPSPVLVQGL